MLLIVTMNEQNEVIDKGAIVIDGNRLSYVGPTEWMPPGSFDRIIEASRMIAMPGMVNCSLPFPRQSGARHDAEQALGNLAGVLPRVFARHAR